MYMIVRFAFFGKYKEKEKVGLDSFPVIGGCW
jgi:hypothetical protein